MIRLKFSKKPSNFCEEDEQGENWGDQLRSCFSDPSKKWCGLFLDNSGGENVKSFGYT